MSDWLQARGISDDDLCATCSVLLYRPGELSLCKETEVGTWPAELDDDGYAVKCAHYLKTRFSNENWVYPLKLKVLRTVERRMRQKRQFEVELGDGSRVHMTGDEIAYTLLEEIPDVW
jgi:hypothetical protein